VLIRDEIGGDKIKLRHKVFEDLRLSKRERVIEEGMSALAYSAPFGRSPCC
jgi:hypothetical protein